VRSFITYRPFTAVALLTLLCSPPVFARSAGMLGRTNTGCGTCHADLPDTSVIVDIVGPTSLTAGATGSYTLRISGGPLVAAGFNAATSAGVLTPGDGSRLATGELTQIAPRAPENGVVSFPFDLTVPEPGQVTLRAVGNSINLNATRDDGDIWNFGTLIVNVVLTPALSGKGAALPDDNGELTFPNPPQGCSSAGAGFAPLAFLALVTALRRRR
jgi:MYXO-CTERM domain-containing protein